MDQVIKGASVNYSATLAFEHDTSGGFEFGGLVFEVGTGGEVGPAVPRQSDEGDVVAAGGFNATAGHNALAVGEEHKHGGRIGGSAGGVVPEPGIEAGQIKFVVTQVIQCVFKGAGEQLPLQINSKETGTAVDVFVAHQGLSLPHEQWPDVDALAALGQDAFMRLFIQPR